MYLLAPETAHRATIWALKRGLMTGSVTHIAALKVRAKILEIAAADFASRRRAG